MEISSLFLCLLHDLMSFFIAPALSFFLFLNVVEYPLALSWANGLIPCVVNNYIHIVNKHQNELHLSKKKNRLLFFCVFLHDVQLILQTPLLSSLLTDQHYSHRPSILYKFKVAFNSRASFVKASACGESGLPTTVGLPASASEQICGCSGISPSNVMPSSSHFFLAPVLFVSTYCKQRWCLESIQLTIKTKHIMLRPTIPTSKRAHILHHPQHFRLRLPKEINSPHRIPKSQILRRRNHNRSIELHGLRDGELHISSAGWQVKHK